MLARLPRTTLSNWSSALLLSRSSAAPLIAPSIQLARLVSSSPQRTLAQQPPAPAPAPTQRPRAAAPPRRNGRDQFGERELPELKVRPHTLTAWQNEGLWPSGLQEVKLICVRWRTVPRAAVPRPRPDRHPRVGRVPRVRHQRRTRKLVRRPLPRVPTPQLARRERVPRRRSQDRTPRRRLCQDKRIRQSASSSLDAAPDEHLARSCFVLLEGGTRLTQTVLLNRSTCWRARSTSSSASAAQKVRSVCPTPTTVSLHAPLHAEHCK